MVVEQHEHGHKRRAPYGGHRVRGDLPVVDRHAQRLTFDRLIRRKILGGDPPAVGAHVGSKPCSDRTCEHRVGALGADGGEAVRKVLDDDGVAGAQRAPIGMMHGAIALGVLVEDGLVGVGEVAGGHRRVRESLATDVLCRANHLGPRQRTESFARSSQPCEGSGDRHRGMADERLHPAAVRHPDPLAEVVRGGETPTGHLRVCVDDDGIAIGRPNGEERPGARADDARLGRHGDDGGGDRGIHGVPARVGHANGGLRGHLRAGGNRNPAHRLERSGGDSVADMRDHLGGDDLDTAPPPLLTTPESALHRTAHPQVVAHHRWVLHDRSRGVPHRHGHDVDPTPGAERTHGHEKAGDEGISRLEAAELRGCGKPPGKSDEVEVKAGHASTVRALCDTSLRSPACPM